MHTSELLARHGIQLNRTEAGNHKTRCPQCSGLRRHHRDPCLSVLIDHDGIAFHCHHCGWSGGSHHDDKSKSGGLVRGPFDRSGNGRTYGSLQRKARPRLAIASSPIRPATFSRFPISRPAPRLRPSIEADRARMARRSFGSGLAGERRSTTRTFSTIRRSTMARMRSSLSKASRIAWRFSVLAIRSAYLSLRAPRPARDKKGNALPPVPQSVDDIDPDHDAKYGFIGNNWERLRKIKRIVLMVDGDEPGERLREELARRIGRVRCHFALPQGLQGRQRGSATAWC